MPRRGAGRGGACQRGVGRGARGAARRRRRPSSRRKGARKAGGAPPARPLSSPRGSIRQRVRSGLLAAFCRVSQRRRAQGRSGVAARGGPTRAPLQWRVVRAADSVRRQAPGARQPPAGGRKAASRGSAPPPGPPWRALGRSGAGRPLQTATAVAGARASPRTPCAAADARRRPPRRRAAARPGPRARHHGVRQGRQDLLLLQPVPGARPWRGGAGAARCGPRGSRAAGSRRRRRALAGAWPCLREGRACRYRGVATTLAEAVACH
jgi:hypothetical protein